MNQENEIVKNITVHFPYLLKFYDFPIFRLMEQREWRRDAFNC